MTKDVQPSPHSRATLSVLQQAVSKVLDRKQRLGQYAVVWQGGAPVMVGGEINDMDVPALLAEQIFLQDQLVALPATEQLTKTNAAARLGKIEAMIAAKNDTTGKAIQHGQPGDADDSVSV